MANQPIPVSTATAMIEEYISYMSDLGADMEQQTHSVSFGSTALLQWMETVQQHTDEFRICMGVYPSGDYAGRITTIIWPYKGGLPATAEEGEIEPFNEGSMNP